MVRVQLEGDTRALLRRMQGFAHLDKKALNAAFGQALRSSTLQRFREGKDPADKRWKSSIRAETTGGKTLVHRARLRNSIRALSDATGFALGTNVKYAATHQFGEPGRTIRAKTAKGLRFQVNGQWVTKKQVKIKIPARPFLGVSEEDQREIKGMLENFIEGT